MANGTMAALRKSRPAPGLELDTMSALPGIGPRDVLVAVRYAGICGTDHHIFDWDEWSANRVPLGIVVGHEFTGTVAAVGEGVSQVTVGQRVSGEGHIGCGVCELCRTGRAHICERIDIIGIDRDGCFAEYVAMPDHNLWVLDQRIPDLAAAIMDPLGNAMHAVSAAQVSGRNVLVTGSGVIGLCCRWQSPNRWAPPATSATDVDPHRLELARHFGADDVVLSSDLGVGGRGATDHGRRRPRRADRDERAPRRAIRGVRRAAQRGHRCPARTAQVGGAARPVERHHLQGRDRAGHQRADRLRHLVLVVEWFLLSGQLDLDALVTDVLPLEKFEEAFALIANRTALKVIFEIGARVVSAADGIHRRAGTALDGLRAAGQYKELRAISGPMGPVVPIGRREVIVLCSYDYLGLANHPDVVAEESRAYGPTERGRPRCASSVAPSTCTSVSKGRSPDSSVRRRRSPSSAAGPPTRPSSRRSRHPQHVISDALNHASIIDAVRQTTASSGRYPHNDLVALEGPHLRRPGRRALGRDRRRVQHGRDLAPLPEMLDCAVRTGPSSPSTTRTASGSSGQPAAGCRSTSVFSAGLTSSPARSAKRSAGRPADSSRRRSVSSSCS